MYSAAEQKNHSLILLPRGLTVFPAVLQTKGKGVQGQVSSALDAEKKVCDVPLPHAWRFPPI